MIASDLLARAKAAVELAESITAHDRTLRDLIDEAAEAVERETFWILASGSFVQEFEDWPDGDDPIELHFKPVSSITSVKYYDENGTQQTWDASNYRFDSGRVWPCIWRADFDNSWPDLASDRVGLIEVTCAAGHASADALHPSARLAVLTRVSRFWHDRGHGEMGGYGPAYRAAKVQGKSTAYLR